MVPTSTDVTIQVKDSVAASAEAVVIFWAGGDALKSLPDALGEPERRAMERLVAGGLVAGKAKELVADVVETGPRKYRRIFVAGLGPREKVSAEAFRQAAARVIRALRKHGTARAAVALPSIEAMEAGQVTEAVVFGALLAAFRFEAYKGTAGRGPDEPTESKPIELTLVATTTENLQAVRQAAERARAIADGQNFARTIAFRPANDINPPALAKVAEEMAREVGLTVRVLDEKEMQKLGMGGILAVGAGSIATPPRMIVLEHKGRAAAGRGAAKGGAKSAGKTSANADRPLLVIGKAITFDTGGISIKPAEKMGRMIFDKCGGMAVLGMMYAIARLKLPVRVVGILASAENAISSKAYRPGDILRMYNGVTVEVTNTDAEGRLVLGDALAWGIETYKPTAVVDLATLTGGVVVALGKSMAGAMTNDDDLFEQIEQASDAAGEKIWRLPLNEELREFMKSDMADIVNSGGREGHPLQGAAFLSYFVPLDGSCPWVHLDIAGVADTEKDLPYYGKGATGWGVRTLVEWANRRAGRA